MWIQRNNVLHGETESEIIAIKKIKCQNRVRTLYKRSRKNLSHEDKKLFQLPLPIRLKGSVTGMTMWIERIEMIFQQKDQDKDNNLESKVWFFPKSKRWRQKQPDVT